MEACVMMRELRRGGGVDRLQHKNFLRLRVKIFEFAVSSLIVFRTLLRYVRILLLELREELDELRSEAAAGRAPVRREVQ